MIHESVASLASRLVRIVGSATLTIVVSMSAIAMPMMSTVSARPGRLVMGTKAGGSPLEVVVVAASVTGVVLPGQFVGEQLGQVLEEVLVPHDVGTESFG